jgi:hypothetical protein
MKRVGIARHDRAPPKARLFFTSSMPRAIRNLFLTTRPQNFAPARPLSLTSLLLTLLFCLASHPAPAQTIGSSCSGLPGVATGSVVLVGAPTATPPASYFLYCTNSSGGTWQLSMQMTDTGTVGIGQTGPTPAVPAAALDVNGGVRIGNDTASCGSANAGELKYNGTAISFCNGSVWGSPAGNSASGTLGSGSGVVVELTAGSAGAPSMTFYADTTTGIYQPSVHAMAFSGGSTERVLFDFSGNLNLLLAGASYEIASVPVLAIPSLDATGTSLAVGSSVLSSGSLSGGYNTGVGYHALYNDTSGASNTAVGYEAALNETTPASNTAIGALSGGSSGTAMTGASNVAVGYQALQAATTANNNVAIGYQAAYSGTTIQYATAIGSQALYSATVATGDYNTAIGYQALYSSTTYPQTAIGYQALKYATTGSHNTAIGYWAMMGNAGAPLTGGENVAVGDSALAALAAGSGYNTAIGYQALQYTSTTTATAYNTAIGYQAMQSIVGTPLTGDYNTAIGTNALAGITTTSGSNTAIGTNALANPGVSSNMVAIGTNALQYETAGNYAVAIGYNAMQSVSGGSAYNGGTSVAIGDSAMASITNATSDGNVAVGYQAAMNLTGGSYDTAFGYQAMLGSAGAQLTGNSNVAFGYQALYAIQGAATQNIAVGASALAALTTGDYNTALGFQAAQYVTTGYYNTAFGYEAMQGVVGAPLTSATGENTAVGDEALFLLQGAALDNTAVGFQAGYNITTGTGNTLLGYTAGSVVTGNSNIIVGEGGNITSGASNILIGNNLSLTTAGSSYQLDIGDLITGATSSATSPNVSLQAASADASVSVQTPTTGFSITITNGVGSLILTPAGTLATGTVNMPSTPVNGQIIRIASTQIVTALTLGGNGHTVNSGVTTISAGTGVAYMYYTTNTTWYRIE